MDERAAKKAHEAALKAEEERRAAEAKAAEGQYPDQGDAQMPDNEPCKEEEQAPEAEDDEDDDMGEEDRKDADVEEPPQLQLTDEEKRMHFRKQAVKDMTERTLSTSFTIFTLPTKEEGFDDVKYLWLTKTKAPQYLKDWVLHRKITTRVEDIVPSHWFAEQWAAWQLQLHKWQQKQLEWKDSMKRAVPPQEAKEGTPVHEQKREGQPEGAEATVGGTGGDPSEEKKEADEMDDDEEDEKEFDVFGVPNVCDIGKGEPLFNHFTFEDWALLSIRFELHILVHSFRRDVSDPERVGIYKDHILFYYNKYFRKTFNLKGYGVDAYEDLVELVCDTVCFNRKTMVLEPQLSGDLDAFDLFIKLTEECRRERNLQIDSGKESARLNFSHAALTGPPPVQVPPAQAVPPASMVVAAVPQQPRPYHQRGPRPQVPVRSYAVPP